MKKKRRFALYGKHGMLLIFSVVILLPLVYTLCNSFMATSEINHYYAGINAQGGTTAFHLIPDQFSLDSYYQVFISRPDYLIKFWVSLFLTSAIVVGQLVISVLAGYALAKFAIPFRNFFMFAIIALMMMPYQVTLVSNYIVLEKIGLLNTYWALVLPGIFSPFGVFLMRQILSTMPDAILEAAKLDGANQFQLIRKIIVPSCKSGIVSLVILSFVDYWNMVEQPLIYLDDPSSYPLSVFLAHFNSSNLGLSFTCGVLAMIPVLLLFWLFENDLTKGIAFSSLK